MRRRLDHPGQFGYLTLEQETRIGGQVMCHSLGTRVGPVGGAESIVRVDVPQPGKGTGKLRVILGLTRLETYVLQQQNIARPQLRRYCLDLLADHGRRLPHLRSEELCQPLPTGRIESDGSTLPFGRPRWETRIRAARRSRSNSIVGNAALIRVSSVTRPSSSGTLKSTRTRALLP